MMDPIDTTTETPAVDTGAAPPAAGGEEITPQAAALDAFGKGVEEQRVADGVIEAPKDEVKPEVDPNKPAPVVDPIDAEIAALGLKDRTAERFRELSKRPAERDVAPLRDKAERFDNWERIIAESTARPEQLSSALGYLQAINSGDPAAMNRAYDSMVQEVAWLGKQLGREVASLYDPLGDHHDLRGKVDAGEMTRDAALELARSRAVSARTDERDAAAARAKATENDANATMQKAMDGLGTLTSELKASDPHFSAKLETLKPMLGVIHKTVHPTQWVQAVREAYATIPNPKPETKPPVGPMPIRPTGGSGGQARKFDAAEIRRGDPFAAGVASVQ